MTATEASSPAAFLRRCADGHLFPSRFEKMTDRSPKCGFFSLLDVIDQVSLFNGARAFFPQAELARSAVFPLFAIRVSW